MCVSLLHRPPPWSPLSVRGRGGERERERWTQFSCAVLCGAVRCEDIIDYCCSYCLWCAFPINQSKGLTDSLKTLLELYDDAYNRNPDDGHTPASHLLRSPNEMEFRAYFLLMFLMDKRDREAESMVRALPASALSDPNIAFVLDVILAVESGNIVRFFNLVRTRATYMQACVLHRSFGHIRLNALRTIKRAFKSPDHTLSFICSRLCFHNPHHAVKFLEVRCRSRWCVWR